MARTPPVKMSFPCNECTFEAQSARQLSRHKAVTHVENALKCVLCPFVTAYQTNLLRHRREVHGICGSKGNKSCKFCGFLSEDNETLIRHQLEVHRDILKSAQVKFAKELVSAGGEETPTSSGKSYTSKYELQSYGEQQIDQKVNVKQEVNSNAGQEEEDDEDDDKNFWKEGFIDDAPNIFMNLATLQQQREQNDNNASNWYSSSGQPSPPSHENSISEFVSSRSSTPKTSIKKMPIPSVGSNDDLPATRIRRQYTCNDCGFRTINPREFLYHRRDEHGQRLKIVECPYCVYACQYVQKLQRHLLLVHKLETSMTPPPEVSQNSVTSKSAKSKSVPQTKALQQQQISKSNSKSQQNFVPKIKVKLPTLTTPAMAISEADTTATSPLKAKLFLPQKPIIGAKRKIAIQRQMSANQKRSNDKSLFAKKYHKCQTCGYMTNVHYLFKKHMKYHSAPKIKCEMCDFESPYSWNVDRHVRSHYSNGLFKCTKCSFACDKKQALTVHMTQHHRDRGNTTAEELQPKIEQIQAIANSNEQEVNEEPVDQDNGDEDIDRNEDSIAHLFTQSLEEGTHMPSNQSPGRISTTFVRQMDGKIVAKQGVLKKCKYCPFQTDTFAKLQKHETSYHPEKKFQCPLCEIKFENLVWLQRHLTHMHQEDSQANNIVNILDLLNPKRKRNKPIPSTSTPLTQSINSMSPEKQVNKKQKVTDKSSTQCQVCGYQTRWISELEKHMRVHTKERPFACPYCSFKSKWKGDLNRHIQKYHSRLPMPDLNLMEQQIQSHSESEMHSDIAIDYNLTPHSLSQSEYNSVMGPENYDNDTSLLSGVDYEEDFDENIEDIKMDDKPLPDDYEERPLVFDDLSDDNEDNEEEAEVEDNDNELQIDFEDRELVMTTDVSSNANESTSEMTKSGKVKMYRCSYCDFTCSTASRFHVHFVQHLNTKPFQCSVCGHRSNWEWDVTKHIKMKSQRDAKHVNAKAMLVHESGKRDYSKYNKYVVWVNQKEAIANNSSNTKIDFRAKRARLEQNDGNECDENEINPTVEADYEEDNYNYADPESIVITPDICFSVQGEDNDSCATGVVDYNQGFNQTLRPNVPYNSNTAINQEESRLLQCYYCDFKHKESKVMVSHLSSHAGMKPYRCRKCGFDSNWREVVVRHCASRHNSSADDVEQRFRCTVTKSMCRIVDENNMTKTTNNVSSHLPSAVQAFQESHQSVRISGFKGSFICDLCPFRAEKAFHMDFHVKRHQPSSGPFKCPHCPYWVNAKKSLVKHMLLHANSDDNINNNQQNGSNIRDLTVNNNQNEDLDESENELVIYEGDDSSNNQNYYNQMNFNIPARQSASVSKNKCDKCPFIAGTKTQLLYHKQFHRPNRNASYCCTMCSYSVSYLHLLNQHMKVHYQNSGEIQTPVNYMQEEYSQEDVISDDDERDESDIPFTFVQIGNNKRKLFQCRFCPTTSKRRTYIYVHERMHTQNTNENFKCSQCSFATRDSTVYLAHLNTHKINTTNDNQPIITTKTDVLEASNSLPITLNQTSFASPSVSVIDVNNIRHGNRRMFSYVCPDCPAAFKSPGDLKIHSAFHGAEHPHPCPYCNYRAKNKPQLCKHLYVHTAEYIAKRANSYPDGTKLLIGDAVDHMKRDLRSPLKETAIEEQERRENTIAFQSMTATSLLKKTPESKPQTPPQSSPPWSAIAKELNGGNLPKRPALFSSGSRTPREQMILLEMTECKAYLEKIRSGGKHRFIYRCSHCPAVFMKVNTLTFHVSMHGNEDEHKCKLCSYSSTSAENLSVHQVLHNYQSYVSVSHSVYNHRCDRCPAAFSKRSRLEKHLTLHGLDAKWKCDKCDYAVHYAATLVKHRACHQLNPNFTIVCSEKDDSNSSNTSISNVSQICNTFKMPSLPTVPTPPLTQSPSNCNEKHEEKVFFCCDRCPYVHNRRDAVQSHQKRHDQQLRNVRDGKQCPYCDYTCLQPSYLRDHIQWHFEPSHDRRAGLFTYFKEIEIWKLKANENEENEMKSIDSNEEKEIIFKDLGQHLNVRQRFEPFEDDEELFEFFNGIENMVSETEEDEDQPPVTNDTIYLN